ncbi:MAG: dienelactone hydrolase family protein [Akkermansiaceae bacterium]
MKLLFLITMMCAPYLPAQLTKVEATAFAKEHYAKLAKTREVKAREVKEGFEYFEISAADKTLRCVGKLYGKAAEGDRSLFISMHGGGGAPPKVNDGQWNNQISLYQPEEGYYVAPRAPTDTWNLWHEAHIDALFSKLIEDFVALRGVNPNKVYLMGYSAGGDGVYQLAPRLADRLGAATMMAGHPNDASPDGLRNLPFRIYMGGKDAAYDRNKVAAQWGEKLSALQKFRGGYDHKVTIYPEDGHWMNRKDAEAVPWMATKTRETWPKKVVWGHSNTRSDRFYWLGGIQKGVIEGEVKGQTITVKGVADQKLTFWLNDQLLDLDQPVKIVIDEKEVFNGKINRSQKAIEESLAARLDFAMVATAMWQQEAAQ